MRNLLLPPFQHMHFVIITSFSFKTFCDYFLHFLHLFRHSLHFLINLFSKMTNNLCFWGQYKSYQWILSCVWWLLPLLYFFLYLFTNTVKHDFLLSNKICASANIYQLFYDQMEVIFWSIIHNYTIFGRYWYSPISNFMSSTSLSFCKIVFITYLLKTSLFRIRFCLTYAIFPFFLIYFLRQIWQHFIFNCF